MAEVFGIALLEPFQFFVAAVLIYVIIFMLLKKVGLFGDEHGVNALIALLATIIVSFSGVLTYAVSYAVNLFTILLIIFFLVMLLLLFLGVKEDSIGTLFSGRIKLVIGILVLLFAVIFFKSFFALNNTFDTSSPSEDPYIIDPSFNTGVDDITGQQIDEHFFWGLSFDSELVGVALFFIVLGAVILLIGRR